MSESPYVSWIDGQQAANQALRKRRAHRQTCTGCPSCEAEAEARKEDR